MRTYNYNPIGPRPSIPRGKTHFHFIVLQDRLTLTSTTTTWDPCDRSSNCVALCILYSVDEGSFLSGVSREGEKRHSKIGLSKSADYVVVPPPAGGLVFLLLLTKWHVRSSLGASGMARMSTSNATAPAAATAAPPPPSPPRQQQTDDAWRGRHNSAWTVLKHHFWGAALDQQTTWPG